MTRFDHGRLPPLLRNFWLWLAGLTAASVAFSESMTHLFHMPPYYSIIRLLNENIFDDYNLFERRFRLFRTPAFWHLKDYPFTYPATTGIVFKLLYMMPHTLRVYLSIYLLCFLLWAAWLAVLLVRQGVPRFAAEVFAFTVLLTAWPVPFVLDTANIEGMVIIVAGAGMLMMLRGRWYLAAALIGFAGAMKLYPFVLLGLLLSRRRYREFGFGLVFAAAVNYASLAILGPTIPEAQHYITLGLLFVKRTFMLSVALDGLPFNHSLFNLVKFAVVGVARGMHRSAADEAWLVDRTLTVYSAVVAVGGFALYFGWIRKLPFLNQLLALTVCGVLLPPLSADYTLLELFVPFGLLCAYIAGCWKDGVTVRGTRLALISFGLIFPTGTYFTWKYMYEAEFRTAGLLVLLYAVLRYPFADRAGCAPAPVGAAC